MIAVAVSLGAVGSAVAQPAPDPAPVPEQAPAPPPAPPPAATPEPSVEPPPPPATESEPRPVKKKPRKPAKKPKPATRPQPLQATPHDVWVGNAASYAPAPPLSIAAAPALELGESNDGGSPALAAGFLLLVAAAGLALAFAAIPGRVLGTVSTRLIEHRDDIGVAVTLSMAVAVVMFLIILVT